MGAGNEGSKNWGSRGRKSKLAERVQVVELEVAESSLEKQEIELGARLKVRLHMPPHNQALPSRIEAMVEEAGQALKRLLYQKIMEQADMALFIARRKGKRGKGVVRIGMRPYVFKTVFGTVRIKRIRIRHKADGSTEVTSHKIWQTPQQTCLSQGLKEAICDLAVKQSYSSTAKRIEERSGEKKLISKTTVKNVMHREGERLRVALGQRAKGTYKAEPEAKRLLGKAEAYLQEEFFEQVWLNKEDLEEEDYDEQELERLFREIDWDPREQLQNLPTATPRGEITALEEQEKTAISFPDPDLVVVQPDEVVVRSQEPDSLWLNNYGAAVITAAKTHYFTAPTSAQLLYQVGSLLTALGVHRQDKRLLVIGDGAAWIRRWVESIGLPEENKESVLCWLHLKKHCGRLLREAIKNKETRQGIKKELLRYLWRGQVEKARAYLGKMLNDIEDGASTIEMSNIKALTALREYLFMRRRHIVDYLSRLLQKKWIASTKIEKFNDWSVSARCKKKNGMKWTQKGVGAIAALEAARRNSELRIWRESGQLPSWEQVLQDAA